MRARVWRASEAGPGTAVCRGSGRGSATAAGVAILAHAAIPRHSLPQVALWAELPQAAAGGTGQRTARRYSANSSGSVILMVGAFCSASCSALDSRRICSAVICRQAGRRRTVQAGRGRAAGAAAPRRGTACGGSRHAAALPSPCGRLGECQCGVLSRSVRLQRLAGAQQQSVAALPLACVGAACLFFTPVTRGSLCSRCEAVVPAPSPCILVMAVHRQRGRSE